MTDEETPRPLPTCDHGPGEECWDCHGARRLRPPPPDMGPAHNDDTETAGDTGKGDR